MNAQAQRKEDEQMLLAQPLLNGMCTFDEYNECKSLPRCDDNDLTLIQYTHTTLAYTGTAAETAGQQLALKPVIPVGLAWKGGE